MEMNAFNPVIKHTDKNWSLKCIIFISSFEVHWGSGLIFYPFTSRLYFLLPGSQLCRLWLSVTAGKSAGHICQWLHQSLLSSQSIKLLIIFSSFTPALLQASLSHVIPVISLHISLAWLFNSNSTFPLSVFTALLQTWDFPFSALVIIRQLSLLLLHG